MIDESNQKWHPVDAQPTENPFTATKETLGERVVSATFLYMKRPFIGLVKGIHSYGLEIIVDHDINKILGMSPNTVIQLNLVDETNEQWINTKVVFQSQEQTKLSVILRFGWLEGPVKI